jgi:hypothetical protein
MVSESELTHGFRLRNYLKALLLESGDYPPVAVMLLDCPDANGRDYATAIAEAEVVIIPGSGIKLLDAPLYGKVFIGSAAYLKKEIGHLSIDDLNNEWDRVCDMMEW